MRYRAGRGEGQARRAVARVFHSHRIAVLEQHLGAQADGLLRAMGDDHLFRLAAQAARAAQVGGDQLAQTRLAGRVAVAQAVRRRVAPEARL